MIVLFHFVSPVYSDSRVNQSLGIGTNPPPPFYQDPSLFRSLEYYYPGQNDVKGKYLAQKFQFSPSWNQNMQIFPLCLLLKTLKILMTSWNYPESQW